MSDEKRCTKFENIFRNCRTKIKYNLNSNSLDYTKLSWHHLHLMKTLRQVVSRDSPPCKKLLYFREGEVQRAAMASQTPSELAISSVRWRQQPSAAPRASKASGGTVCSLSSACLAPEPASASAVQGRAGPAFYRHSPPGAQATTGAEAAVACSEFDDARQPSFRCLRLEPVPGPDGATVEAPTPLDPNFEDLSRELSAPPAIWLWTCKD